jgi:hypothetical protein
VVKANKMVMEVATGVVVEARRVNPVAVTLELARRVQPATPPAHSAVVSAKGEIMILSAQIHGMLVSHRALLLASPV